jgi:hypothetical protein
VDNNGPNIERRLPSHNPFEVACYVAIAFMAFSCAATTVAMWLAVAGLCSWWIPPLIGLTVAGIASVAFAVWLIKDRNDLLWEIERATGRDIDQDGQVGRPRFVYVHGAQDSRRHKQIEEAERFRLFLQGVYGERGPTWRAWEDVLTQEQWQEYCGRLLDAKLAERKGETSPLTLCSEYRDALAAFRELWQ